MPRIDTSDDAKRWRYGCPECGSTNWRANNGSFGCVNCGAKTAGLIDKRTGEYVHRDEIEFVGLGLVILVALVELPNRTHA